MRFYWSTQLEDYVQNILKEQALGHLFPRDETFLDLQTGVYALRNRDLFYYDGYEYHLTLDASNARDHWWGSRQRGEFTY